MDMTVEVPELPELTFDEASHIYRLNGDIIPSVSKLMEPLKDQCYGGISKRTLENAAIKGSAVHNSIENWIKFGIDDIPSEHRGYFNGFVEWWKQYKPRVFGSEVRIYHKLMRYTSGGSTTLVFEDVPATQERCDALKGLARDTGGIAAMVPVRPMQKKSWERSELKRWLNEQVRDDAEEMRRYLDEQHQPESGSSGTDHEGRS